MTTLKDAEERAAAAALKAELERDRAQAMRDYHAEKLAVAANTERLRALRLAKESADAQLAAAKRPVTKQAAKPASTPVRRRTSSS
jgi:hypothetical protein